MPHKLFDLRVSLAPAQRMTPRIGTSHSDANSLIGNGSEFTRILLASATEP